MISILIADDQALVRAGFRALLNAQSDMQVVGEAEDGAEAVAQTALLHPQVVLMDVRMPVMDGLQATRRIVEDHPSSKILVLTTFDRDEYVYDALRSGASGFLLKDARPTDLIAGIRIVHEGEALLSPRATRLLVQHFTVANRSGRSARVNPAALDHLTDRERDVLRLIATGLSNAEICAELVLSLGTVKTHIGHLLTKLDARDRAQLVVTAYTSGFTA